MTEDKEEEAALALWRAELEYRRKKQWDIFVWAATLLVASIGAVFALAVKGEFKFAWGPRFGFAVALLGVAAYAWRWIDLNIDFEKKARTNLVGLYKVPRTKPSDLPDPDTPVLFGYVQIILGLGFAAAVVVLVPPECYGIK